MKLACSKQSEEFACCIIFYLYKKNSHHRLKMRVFLLVFALCLLTSYLAANLLPFLDNETNNTISTLETPPLYQLIGCNMLELMKNKHKLQQAVRWTYPHGIPVLTIVNCSLHVINVTLARQCIATHSPRGISLIGDSLTRYQYLNLAHFLATGKWSSDPLSPNERESSHASWPEFYRVTNARMMGHEICDCSRNPHHDIIEHRYFEMDEIKLSYIQLFGSAQQIRYHDPQWLNISSCSTGKCQQSFCTPGNCLPTTATSLGTITSPGVLASLVKIKPADDVFINAGHWWPNEQHQNSFALHKALVLTEAKNALEAKSVRRFHWKVTTASMTPLQAEYPLANELVNTSIFHGMFDTWALTSTLDLKAHMWDSRHFQPAVYIGLNQALIAYICSL